MKDFRMDDFQRLKIKLSMTPSDEDTPIDPFVDAMCKADREESEKKYKAFLKRHPIKKNP